MTNLFQSVKKMASSEAGTWFTVYRMLFLGVAAAVLLSIFDVLFPGYDALEEVGVVVLLTVIEVGRTRMKQNSTSQANSKKQTQATHLPSKVMLSEPFSKAANFVPRNLERSEDTKQANLCYRPLQQAAKAVDVSAAEAAMKKMHDDGIVPSIACYGTLVGLCAKTGDVVGAESWLEALANSGLGNPNVICVNMVISACAKSGKAERAAAWLQRMPSLGVEPDVMSYNAVIDACAQWRSRAG